MAEYLIKAVGSSGDGVANGPVFAPRTLPGERVTGDVSDDRLNNVRIVQPSEDRVAAPCRHFKSCGGCTLQHASDDWVAGWKHDLVARALGEHGLQNALRDGCETSPVRSRRRAKLAARRTKSGAMAGFHGRASHSLVDVQDCPLATDPVNAAFDMARDLAAEFGSRKGELTVHVTDLPNGLDVKVEDGKPLDDALRAGLPGLAERHRIVRLIWGDDLVAQTDVPHHPIGSAQVPLPAGAFLQATKHGERTLQDLVREATQGARQIADLFAGCGTFALALAQHAPVHAFEGDAAMARALQEAANRAGLTFPVTATRRDLFRDPLLKDELAKFDAVVLDPPRAGAMAQIEMLAESDVQTISYVSCDPKSFARDAAILTANGYQLDWVQALDQFRWSAHVELASRFSATG